MTSLPNEKLQKPLRVWPGVVILILALLLRFGLPIVAPELLYIGVMGGFAGSLLVVLWWLFFSRAAWVERIGAVVLMVAAIILTRRVVDKSISMGAMGMLFYILGVQTVATALVVWAVLTRRLSKRARRVSMVATILLACGIWTLIRTGGFSGEFKQDFAWRWSATPEQRLLAQEKIEPAPITPAPAPAPAKIPEQKAVPQTTVEPAITEAKVEPPAEWPGFRGPERNDVIRGVSIKTDWSASPPKELWRRKIGPGWSSFAVRGNFLYTQEQRGEEEVVACYNKNTGKPVWRHRDPARFWESNAGAGPRGTPTVHNGRVYALGATGILNALDADTGAVVWSRNAANDTKTKVPGWGFSSSPLVMDDIVIVATAGRLAAYEIETGKPRWIGPKHGTDYSSPHLLTIGGVPQVLLLNLSGVTSVEPASGKVLWEYPLAQNARIVQPALTPDGDVLINEGEGKGLRRVTVSRGPRGWKFKEHWTSIGLKPYFSDFVIHDGHAFGFDGSFLSCIDLKTGERKWKGGHYGSGQLVLLADQDVMLVLSEKGELALVSATTDQFMELARHPAIEGKTWNHPVIVGKVLVVRNGEEMAAFRLM